jgi:hypothetical protein
MANWTPEGGVGSMFRSSPRSSPRRPRAPACRSTGAARARRRNCWATPSISTWRSGCRPGTRERGGVLAEFSPGFGPLKTLLENSDDAKRAEIHDTFIDTSSRASGRPAAASVTRATTC